MGTMKRIFAMVMMLSLSMTGTAGAQAPFDAQAAQAAAEAVYAHFVGGEYDAIHDMLDDSIKQAVTADALAAGYLSEGVPAGAFEGIADSQVSEADGVFTVVLTAQHAESQVRLICVFGPDGKLTGLNIANLGKVVEVADPLPLALPEGAEERPVTLHDGTAMALGGALVLPAGYGADTPVVIMAQGSGASDLDETIGPNKPFRDIAYGLAACGIASLWYDKLHYAHPELATADLTIDDEYTGTVLEALAVARAQTDLGPAYLLGHSLGGMLTPYLMEKSEGGFAGGIILAGTPRQLWELIRDQNLALLEGVPEETLAMANEQLAAEEDKLATLDQMDEAQLRSTAVFNLPGPYLAHMLRIDPLALAHENNLPLLILQGEEDFQVSYAIDYAAWQAGLADMGELVTYKSYPGLSHLFMPAEGSIHNVAEA